MSDRPGRARRLAADLKKAVLSRRVVSVQGGPAAGLRFSLHMASADYSDGHNEAPVQQAFCDHVGLGDTVHDIGANVGFFSCLAARLVGSEGDVHAFEAVPACATALRRNVERNGFTQVAVHPVAVTDHAGEVEVLQGRHPGGATISERDRPRDYRGSVSVPGVVIDELVASGELPPPDFVKIDVEGAEPEVLRGMRVTLDRHHPVVLCELDAPTAEGVAAKVAEVRTLLESAGYHVDELERSYLDSRSEVVHLLATVPA